MIITGRGDSILRGGDIVAVRVYDCGGESVWAAEVGLHPIAGDYGSLKQMKNYRILLLLFVTVLVCSCGSHNDRKLLADIDEDDWFIYISYDNTGESLVAHYVGSKIATVYDTQTGDVLLMFDYEDISREGGVFSSDGEHLLLLHGNEIFLVDPTTGDIHWNTVFTDTYRVNHKALFSHDNSFVLTKAENVIKTWDVETGNQISEIEIDDSDGICSNSIDISSDDQTIVVAGCDVVRFYDRESGELVNEFEGYERIIDIQVSPDNTYIAILRYEWDWDEDAAYVHLVTWDDGIEIAQTDPLLNERSWWLEDPSDMPSMAFSPDGSRIAAYPHEGREVIVWDISSDGVSQCMAAAVGGGPTQDIAYSPTGEEIAVAVGNSIWLLEVDEKCR